MNDQRPLCNSIENEPIEQIEVKSWNYMDRRAFLFSSFGLITLQGCAQAWSTDYSSNVSVDESIAWRIRGIEVAVPGSLTVSEANVLIPDADIVWQGEPPGDRRAQVKSIFEEAAQRATIQLSGKGRSVDVEIEVTRFHALTDRARTQLSFSGVHNLDFNIQVKDANTRELLASEDGVTADLVAYAGQQSRDAIARGETQRVRIVAHLTSVISAWLGVGPDVRSSFVRRGA